MNKTGKKQTVKAGIMTKMLAMALGPLIVLALSTAFFSARTIRSGMQDEAIKRLEDIVCGVKNSMDALAAIANNNLSKVMNFLAMITLMVAVPTFITSFFGMNLPMPLASHPLTTLVVLLACLLAIVLCYVLLRKINSLK